MSFRIFWIVVAKLRYMGRPRDGAAVFLNWTGVSLPHPLRMGWTYTSHQLDCLCGWTVTMLGCHTIFVWTRYISLLSLGLISCCQCVCPLQRFSSSWLCVYYCYYMLFSPALTSLLRWQQYWWRFPYVKRTNLSFITFHRKCYIVY